MSSTEAEIIAASAGALEAVYFRRMLGEMGLPQHDPTIIYVDNSGAVELSKHQKSCHRSRHVLRRYFKVRELMAAGEVEVRYCPTDLNWSDFLTKTVTPLKWEQCRDKAIGAQPISPTASTAAVSGDPLAAWALHLGVPLDVTTYAQYMARCGDVGSCACCDLQCVDCDDDTESPIEGGHAQTMGNNSSTPTSPASFAAPSFEILQAQLALTPDGDILNPAIHGLYASGIDDNVCAFPVTTPEDNPSYDAAQRGPHTPLWDDACNAEIENLRRFGAFDEPLVREDEVPDWDRIRRRARSVTETIWVLRRKYDSKDQLSKYKARCVYNNKRRVDCSLVETFSPAVRHTTVKAAVACSVLLGRKRVGFDVTGAYLQGEYTNEEIVYARPPKGHRTFDDDGVPLIWRMRVPLYGQGDAGLVWFRTIRKQLTATQGFNQSDADPSYFYKRSSA